MSDKLLDRYEASARLGVKPSTLDNWASTGKYDLPYVKVGRFRRYRESDIAAFTERRTFIHTGQYPRHWLRGDDE